MLGVLPYDPPRRTCQALAGGSAGPVGSVTSPGGYAMYQSEHHWLTFPHMSNRPQGLGLKIPTCVVFARDMPLTPLP